jgi:hypothetical protein
MRPVSAPATWSLPAEETKNSSAQKSFSVFPANGISSAPKIAA